MLTTVLVCLAASLLCTCNLIDTDNNAGIQNSVGLMMPSFGNSS